MKMYAISQIPVMDGNEVVGIVTERGILEAFESRGYDISELRAGELMGPPPPIVRRDTHIRAIVELLKQYPAVLVQDEGKIVGIITKSDVVYFGVGYRRK
jgi:predicted transcriptional regulator